MTDIDDAPAAAACACACDRPISFFFFQSSRVCFSSFTLSVTYVAQPQSCSTWVTYMELINGTWCVSLASMGRGLGEQPCRTKRLTACPRAHVRTRSGIL